MCFSPIRRCLRSADLGLRSADLGLRSADLGLRSAGLGLRNRDLALRDEDSGLRGPELALRGPELALRDGDSGSHESSCQSLWETVAKFEWELVANTYLVYANFFGQLPTQAFLGRFSGI